MKSPTQKHKFDNTIPQPRRGKGYARVSTGRQEKEETIESQIEELKQGALNNGIVLSDADIFIDDGWTGEMIQRPALDEMRDAAEANEFDVLYVYDRGRLSRNYAHQEIIIEELTDRGIEFMTLHDVQATTPEERVLQSMQGVFHEYERIKIAERMRRGKMFKAKQGSLINGQSLYGYTRIKKTDETPARVIINQEEADVVRKIFHWFGNEKLSLFEIRRRLHEEGIMPRKGKNEYWTKGPISRLLQCETYIDGIIHYNKSEAIVPKNPTKNGKYKKVKKTSRRVRPKDEWIPYRVPVILKDRNLFDRVQEILNSNKRQRVAHPKYEYLLTGLIWCACGMRRVGDGSSRHGHCYYRCAERLYHFEQKRTCFIAGLNAAALDFVFWNELSALLTDAERLEAHADISNLQFQQERSQPDNQTARVEQFITQIDAEMKRYNKAFGAGVMEFEQLQELMQDAKKRKVSYLKQLKKIRTADQQNPVVPIRLDLLCQEAREVIETLDTTNQKEIIRDVIDKILIREDDQVEVCGHIDLTKPAPKGLGSRHEDRHRRSPQCGKIHSV